MKKQFCTYEIALALKELGFDDKCFTKWVEDIGRTSFSLYPILATVGLNTPYKKESNGYNQAQVNEEGYTFTGYKNSVLDHGKEIISAPLWQQVIDWFDKAYNLLIVVKYDKIYGYKWDIRGKKNKPLYRCAVTYQRLCDAREESILEAIELCKKKK